MSAPGNTKRAAPSTEKGDWIVTFVLLAIMAMAFIATKDWPSDTAFFPRLLSGVGVGLSALRILILLRTAHARRPSGGSDHEGEQPETFTPRGEPGDEPSIAIEGPDSDEEGDENELHDIFTSADLKTWAGVLGWFAFFLVGLYLLGFLAILAIFTVSYLRVVKRMRYWQCGLYVLATAGIIYLLFVMLLHLPLPLGLLTASLGF